MMQAACRNNTPASWIGRRDHKFNPVDRISFDAFDLSFFTRAILDNLNTRGILKIDATVTFDSFELTVIVLMNLTRIGGPDLSP